MYIAESDSRRRIRPIDVAMSRSHIPLNSSGKIVMPKIPGLRRYVRVGRSDEVRRRVDDEIAFHFAMCVDELVAGGMSRDDATAEAGRRFGDVAAIRDRLTRIDRERLGVERRADWVGAMWQDVRYAARGLRRTPGFTIGVVVTLALGIGANAAVFTFIDRLLLRPPPHVVDAANLRRVNIEMTFKNGNTRTRGPMSYAEFAALRSGVQTFDRIGAFQYPEPVALGRGFDAPRVKRSLVSADFFRTLGVRPSLGRFFVTDDDDEAVSRPAAVLGHGMWQRQFGGRSTVIGEQIVLDGRPFVVVGVAPKEFSGIDVDAPDVWVPMAPVVAADNPKWRENKNGFSLHVVAHLRAGSTAEQAAAQGTAALRPAYRGTFMADLPANVRLGSVVPGKRLDRTDSSVSIATRLLGGAAMVLLIACANVANLLLSRAVARRRELAVRLALGVGRARLVGQLLTESVVLAVLAGVCALVIAVWGGSLLRSVLMPNVTWASDPWDGRVLVFTAVVTALVGLAAGIAPAFQMTRQDLTTSLKSSWRDSGGGRSAVRSALVIVQAAFTVILLVGAGLFIRSLDNVKRLDLGFAVDETILAELSFTKGSVPRSDRDALVSALVDRVKRAPGVALATLTTTAPYWTLTFENISIPGRDSLPNDLQAPPMNPVAPEFFRAMGIRLIAGRELSPDDRADGERVAVVNETMARRVWPGEAALGRCIKVGADTMPCTTVVGIVADVGFQSLREVPPPQFYVPVAQSRGGTTFIVARTDGSDAREVASRIRGALRGAHPNMESIDVRPIADLLAPEIRPFRLGAMMFGVLGGLALLLAGVGLYAVISFGVARRKRELGIRSALGARLNDVVGLVMGESVRLTAAGVVLGLVIALLLGRVVEAMLFGASPRDPTVFAVVAVTLVAVAALAGAIPAWRASRVDPVTALRDD
jgi:predicted permease